MIWTAARIDAEEAYRIGLCERLVDDADLEKEVEVARARDRRRSRRSRCRARSARSRRPVVLPIAEGLVVEAEAQSVCLRSDDMREAITAFVEQRPPRYQGMTRGHDDVPRPRRAVRCTAGSTISGASKNAGTKQMAAALLAPGVTTLRNMPVVRDLEVMAELLRAVGAEVELLPGDEVRVDASGELRPEAPYELVSRMRASFNVLGPLLARCGEARVALPGGDSIGSRKVDMHLRGLEAMGAHVEVEHGFVHAHATRLAGARHVLEFPSVGATENLMCAAVLAKGSTVIENAAREPEVTDLAAFLDRMGAQVVGAGTSTIEIEGVDELAACRQRDHGRPPRSRHAADGVRHRGRRDRARRHAPRAPRDRRDEAVRDGHARVADTRRHLGAESRPAARGRRRDAAASRVRHRLHADRGRARWRSPTAARSSPRTSTTAASTSSTSSRVWAPTCAPKAATRSCAASSGSRARPVTAADVRAGAALVLAGLAADGETDRLRLRARRPRASPTSRRRCAPLGADVERLAA